MISSLRGDLSLFILRNIYFTKFHSLIRSSLRHMAEWWSTCNHYYLYRWLLCQYFILLMMGAWRPKHVEKACSNKICILLYHIGVLLNLNFTELQYEGVA